ncbi:MAG: hypothetical protein ACOYBS_06665 [Flavobacterium sp.]
MLVIFSIIPLIFLSLFIYVFYKRGRKFEAVIFFATLIHETILVSYTTIYAVINDFKFEKLLRFEVENYDLLKVILIENIFIIFFLVPFLFQLKAKSISFESASPKIYKFFALISFLGVFVYLYQLINRPSIEQIVDSYANSGLPESSNKFVSFFTITFQHASIIIASILSIRGKNEFYPKKYQYIGIFMLISVLIMVLFSGIRGGLIYTAEFVLLISILKKKKKPIFIMLLLLILFIPLNNILLTKIRPISEEIAKEGGVTTTAVVNIVSTIFTSVNDRKEESPSIFESLCERAQGPRNSVALIKQYDQGLSQDLSIYKGAFFVFVPRFIMDRPVYGSSSDSFEDAGIFKVMQLNYDATFINMGPLLASAHAYWEGGYLGVAIIALLTSFFWSLILKFSYKIPPFLGLVFCLLTCCALLIDGFITIFYPLYSFIGVFWKSLLPLYLFYIIYFKIKIPKLIFYRK